MFSAATHQEWARLCRECDIARDEYFKALNEAHNFMNTDRATTEEVAVYAAEARWDECIRRLKEFREQYLDQPR